MCDLQLRKIITFLSESDSGVIRLYGKPIESIFQPYACGGHWVPELAGKGLSSKSGRLSG